MNILLVNINPIVSKLFALSAKSIVNVHIDEIDSSGLIPKNNYDILFVDDDCCDSEKIQEFFFMVQAKKKILCSNKHKHTINTVNTVDAIIVKPFLPSQIIEILQTIEENQENIIDEIESLHNHQKERIESNAHTKRSMILNSDEIDTIKKLLLNEEEFYDDVSSIREALLYEDEPKEVLTENIIEALTHMESQKIREILAGAEIKIKIKFPKEV